MGFRPGQPDPGPVLITVLLSCIGASRQCHHPHGLFEVTGHVYSPATFPSLYIFISRRCGRVLFTSGASFRGPGTHKPGSERGRLFRMAAEGEGPSSVCSFSQCLKIHFVGFPFFPTKGLHPHFAQVVESLSFFFQAHNIFFMRKTLIICE